MSAAPADGPAAVRARVSGCDWSALAAGLEERGHAVTATPFLTPRACAQLREGFADDGLFRSTIDMARYRFGEGTYRYYAYDLPPAVSAIRKAAYPPLAELANAWARRLGQPVPFPSELGEYVERCHAAGQTKPTPLILRYGPGGYNTLHQDLYGELAFPFQLTVALTEAGADFTGGENLFVEQRPRAQSRGTAVNVPLGHAVIFPTRHRPVAGTRGTYRATVKHGVSTVTSGQRFSLGVIFHDAA